VDIQARLEKLRAWAESSAGDAAYLAAKDFKWWLDAIASAAADGKRFCKDSRRMWYVHRLRSNPHYCRALGALLGEGFKVEGATAYDSDAMEDYTFNCIEVSW